jgi:hypothetical protein
MGEQAQGANDNPQPEGDNEAWKALQTSYGVDPNFSQDDFLGQQGDDTLSLDDQTEAKFRKVQPGSALFFVPDLNPEWETSVSQVRNRRKSAQTRLN